jgi:hypothetical protein
MRWDWIIGFSNYTDSLRPARRLLDRSFRPAVITAYRPLLQAKAHVLLTQMLANPDEFEAHLFQFVSLLWLASSLSIVPIVQPVGIPNLSYGVWLRSQGAQ